jgi:hypothetical protein
MNNDNTPDPESILYPEDATDEQLEILCPVLIPKLERLWLEELGVLIDESATAAREQETEALRSVFAKLRNCESWATPWNRRWGARATVRTLALQTAFHDAAENIALALNGNLPGQEGRDPSDDWKN